MDLHRLVVDIYKMDIFNSSSTYSCYICRKKKENKKYRNYFDGNEILIFNNLQHLELAIYRSNPQSVGSSSTLHGINYRDKVSISFIDN